MRFLESKGGVRVAGAPGSGSALVDLGSRIGLTECPLCDPPPARPCTASTKRRPVFVVLAPLTPALPPRR
ncbi:MAG: hypothetical protein FJW23_07660 [Acidimicrobiia bacterium]|nr:hypothetical protein [Acidimicrobiia bacterium]